MSSPHLFSLRLWARCAAVIASLIWSRGVPADDLLHVDYPECRPKKAILRLDYLFKQQLPRTPPIGYMELRFTVSNSGKAQDLVVIRSTMNWSPAETIAREAVASALFEPPSKPCSQTMRFSFSAKSTTVPRYRVRLSDGGGALLDFTD